MYFILFLSLKGNKKIKKKMERRDELIAENIRLQQERLAAAARLAAEKAKSL